MVSAVLVNGVGRLVKTVLNATIKTTVKKLPFYGRTTERNTELFLSPTVALGLLAIRAQAHH